MRKPFKNIEIAALRDRLFAPDGSGTWVMRPPGDGWNILDFAHDKHTVWTRRRTVVAPRRRATRGGGGWR